MHEIRSTLSLSVDEQLKLLTRGVADLVSEADLRRKLERSQKSGERLRVKLGADPTRPDLHLGHAVVLRKMRQFQDLGHRVIMLIGDFTATIGDPSGKSKTRPPLSLEQARANAESYLGQCRTVLRGEPELLEIRWNSEWLTSLGYRDIIELTSRYTVARILERDDFSKRLREGTPISVHELLYPLTQGYDSVALCSDVELGGTDQLFNNLVGRALQRDYGQEPQVVLTLPILTGLDGREKMSKSLDNYVPLDAAPHDLYAGLMRVPDPLLGEYFRLLTDLPPEEIAAHLAGHPVAAHHALAAAVLGWLAPQADVSAARERFAAVAAGGVPQDLPEIPVPVSEVGDDGIAIARLVVLAGLEPSNGAARKLIGNRGLRLDGETVSDPQGRLAGERLRAGAVLQKGKGRFARVVLAE